MTATTTRLRTAANLMRTQRPDHERHDMWAAVADWLDRVADDEPSWSYAHAEVEMLSAIAVADAYLLADAKADAS